MKTTKKQIKLCQISDVLDGVRKAYKCLGVITPLIRDPDLFSAEFCHEMLEIKPPLLVQKDNDYFLVAGYREWQMALHKLDSNEKIDCQVVTEASQKKLNSLAWHDAYGCMLAYGISQKKLGQQLREVLTLMDNDVKLAHFSKLSNISQLKRATEMSRSAFYLPKTETEIKKQLPGPLNTFS